MKFSGGTSESHHTNASSAPGAKGARVIERATLGASAGRQGVLGFWSAPQARAVPNAVREVGPGGGRGCMVVRRTRASHHGQGSPAARRG